MTTKFKSELTPEQQQMDAVMDDVWGVIRAKNEHMDKRIEEYLGWMCSVQGHHYLPNVKGDRIFPPLENEQPISEWVDHFMKWVIFDKERIEKKLGMSTLFSSRGLTPERIRELLLWRLERNRQPDIK